MSAATDVFKLLVHSAKQVVQVVANGEKVVCGEAASRVALLEQDDGTGISIVVDSCGKIYDLGTDEVIAERYKSAQFLKKINAEGRCIVPGLVDAHTHPVWAGDRVNEFAMKLAGATYMDVHKAGGGIYYTVEQTRKSSEQQLLLLLVNRLNEMLRSATTLVEAKSGYGLDAETEMKMLRVIERARAESRVDISSTFCGAHAVPKGMSPEEATESVLKEQLPALKHLLDSKELTVDNIDVFCEEGVFDVNQSRQILEAGRRLGLQINFHGDELHPVGAAEMGAELRAEAISHLEEVSAAGISAMASSGTVAVLLPTTAYILRLKPPPARKMIEAGVPVALGSDFNPNAFCLAMPMVMHLSCVLLKLSMPEALHAATINAAKALGKSETHGSLEKGKFADMIIINADRWEHLIYQMGCHHSLIHQVIKKGDVVHENQSPEQLVASVECLSFSAQ